MARAHDTVSDHEPAPEALHALPASGPMLALLASPSRRRPGDGPAARPARIPVILDTDIGDDIDDTWALVLALRSPELDLRLVVTDYGNTEHRAKLVARLLEVAGRTDIPIGVGVKENDEREPPGRVGAGLRPREVPRQGALKDGVQALVDAAMAAKEPMTLVAIGPPPNLKAALEREPRIAGKLRLAGMYGSLRRGYGGKPKPEPEWNVKARPAAARALLARPGGTRSSTPLDTCGLVQLDGRAVRPRPRRRRTRWCGRDRELCRLVPQPRTGAPRTPTTSPRKSTTLFDPVAVYLAISRDLVKTVTTGVRVTDEGMTMPDPRPGRSAWATEWKDLDGFEEWLTDRLAEPAAGRWGGPAPG